MKNSHTDGDKEIRCINYYKQDHNEILDYTRIEKQLGISVILNLK